MRTARSCPSSAFALGPDRCRPAAPVRPADRRPASPVRRRLAARSRQAAEIEAERAVARPHQGELRLIQLHRPRHDAPEQQLVERQRHLGAGNVHPSAARLIGHRDIGQRADRAADRRPCGTPPMPARQNRSPAASGRHWRWPQPPAAPVNQSRSTGPCDSRQAIAATPTPAQHRQRDRQRAQPVHHHGGADCRLTRKTPHAQPFRE